MGIEEEPEAVGEKVMTAFERVRLWPHDSQERDRVLFWLGTVKSDPEVLLLLDLALADKISFSAARKGEPLTWIRAMSYFQELDGDFQTPEAALDKYLALTAMEREVLLESYARAAHQLGGPSNPRRAPSPRDLERMKLGAVALTLGEPTTKAEIREQLDTLTEGAIALQSLDDLGTDVANARAARDLATLNAKIERLGKKLEET